MRLITAATCILVTLSAALGACSEPENANQRERVAVVAQELRSLPERSTLEAIGSARAATSAQIFPESDGRVTRVLFSAGEFVRKGQPLIEMDARRERLAVEAARVEVREAEQLLSRYRRIEDTGAISDSQIEAGETALASAGVALRQAQVALDDRIVRAPFSGHVGLTEVDPGDRIDSATPIAQLDSRGTLYVDFPAPEAVFRELRAGQTVRVTPFAGTADPIAATDTRISRDSRDFIVRAAIPNEGDRFRPGMSFRQRAAAAVGGRSADRLFHRSASIGLERRLVERLRGPGPRPPDRARPRRQSRYRGRARAAARGRGIAARGAG